MVLNCNDMFHKNLHIRNINPIQVVHVTLQLTHKQLETHGCVLSTVAANALMLMHQAISIHRA